MATIKPRITLPGYQKALKEYGSHPSRIVEELVANSYDADATIVAIIHSDNEIIVADNGTGISEDQFPKLLDLGSGTKIGEHDSELKRSYLGSFGFGIKATINVSKNIAIFTSNKISELSCEIDTGILESHGFKDSWKGFEIEENDKPKASPTGTIIKLKLKNELSPDDIEMIKRSLYNLPKAENFEMYFIPSKRCGKDYSPPTSALKNLKSTPEKYKEEKIKGTLDIGSPKKIPCTFVGSEKINIDVWCKGLDENLKVPSLGQFAGVYVKVDGRVLKKNFQGEKGLEGVSKYAKFRHGMRVEVPIDWIKGHISLGRDGLQFGNESSKNKFEQELKHALTAAVRPFAKELEDKKSKKLSRDNDLRKKKAIERISKQKQIKSLEKTGFCFAPTDDYEMALIIANPSVMAKISPNWQLMDFNGQLDFDCLIYDKSNTNFYNIELEPRLETFVNQGVLDNTDYIVTWTRGDWKVGKGKKGKKGYFELVETTENKGHYKLLVKASEKSKEPKKALPVYCLDQLIK